MNRPAWDTPEWRHRIRYETRLWVLRFFFVGGILLFLSQCT